MTEDKGMHKLTLALSSSRWDHRWKYNTVNVFFTFVILRCLTREFYTGIQSLV